jgi:hypothetical protein
MPYFFAFLCLPFFKGYPLSYNIVAMNHEDFITEEQTFLSDFESSSLYQDTKRLSEEISQDPELVALARERDDLTLLSTKTEDEKKQRDLQIQAKQKNDLLLSNPKMKEYLEKFHLLQKILSYPNQILREAEL